MKPILLAAASASLLVPSRLLATTALDYNVVVSGNFYATSSDVQGRVAASGNISVGSYSIGATTAANSGYVAVAGGTFDANGSGSTSGSVLASNYSGNVGGTFSIGGAADTYAGGHTSPIAIASEMARLSALSQDLQTNSSAYGVLGTTEYAYNQIFLVGSSTGTNIFTVDGGVLGNNYGIHIAVPMGALAVLNVSGAIVSIANTGSDSSTYNGQNVGFSPASYDAANVLYNFYQAAEVDPIGSVSASILATGADMRVTSGVVTGQVFAKSYSGNEQVNSIYFNGKSLLSTAAGAVPEPATWGMMIVGFGVLGWAMRRHRRQGRAVNS